MLLKVIDSVQTKIGDFQTDFKRYFNPSVFCVTGVETGRG